MSSRSTEDHRAFVQLPATSIPFTMYFLAPCRFLACIKFIHQPDVSLFYQVAVDKRINPSPSPPTIIELDFNNHLRPDLTAKKKKGIQAFHGSRQRHPISSSPTGPVFLDGSSVSHMKPRRHRPSESPTVSAHRPPRYLCLAWTSLDQ